MSNPFSKRPEPKKSHVGMSMTREQAEAFQRIKGAIDAPSDSAVLRRGLELLYADTFPVETAKDEIRRQQP